MTNQVITVPNADWVFRAVILTRALQVLKIPVTFAETARALLPQGKRSKRYQNRFMRVQ